jgi:lipoprotein-anchoring transpeptidase ErfK/SrfK
VAFDALRRTSGRGRRALLLCGAALAAVAALILAAYLYDQGRGDVIAPGIRIAGVNVGGLRAPAARARLRDQLRGARAYWITVRYGTRRFTLTGSQARLRVDVDGAVRQAVMQSRGGWLLSRTIRELFGGQIDRSVPLPVTYSRITVQALVARIRSAIDRPARDASVTVDSGAQLVSVRSRVGAVVDVAALRGELASALRAPAVPHLLSLPVGNVKPRITTAMLAAEYPAYIVIDRRDFKLLLYQHLHLTHTYPIAVGRAGLETPAGLHHILDKQVNPSWHVPHSAWAGSLAGRVIPPGPQDPLVARWMAIDDQGDGIHGTNEPWSIGSAASHGCIRMLVPDVIQLYSLTPLGSPAYVI